MNDSKNGKFEIEGGMYSMTRWKTAADSLNARRRSVPARVVLVALCVALVARHAWGAQQTGVDTRGEPSSEATDAAEPCAATILAAGARVRVYVNGRTVGNARDYRIARFNVALRPGDVVSVHGEDLAGGLDGQPARGVAAAVLFQDGHTITTGSDAWRVAPAFDESKGLRTLWMHPSYDARHWSIPRPVANAAALSARVRALDSGFPSHPYSQSQSQSRFSDDASLLARTGAQFVWTSHPNTNVTISTASGAATSTAILLRVTARATLPNNIATLYVTGKDVHVFVNGAEKGYHHGEATSSTLKLQVRNGDVIGAWAEDTSTRWGVAAALVMPDGRTYATGSEAWLGTKGFEEFGANQAWQKPGFDICEWNSASPIRFENHGRGAGFPFAKTGARFVWADNASSRDEIFLRMQVGVTAKPQNCKSKRTDATIYSSGNDVHLFVNGEEIDIIHDAFVSKSIKKPLRSGDLVSIWSEDRTKDYGVLLLIEMNNGRRFITTGVDAWRATRAFGNFETDRSWMNPSFDVCGWPLATPVTNFNPSRAVGFPFVAGTRSVWASNAKPDQDIYMRFTIDGGYCSTLFISGKDVHAFLNGREIGHSHDETIFTKIRITLNEGDVVALWAEDTSMGYGLVAAIVRDDFRQTPYATGKEEWRAVRAFEEFASRPWMLPSYDACSWSDAAVIRTPPGRAKGFPFATTLARFVWAARASPSDSVFLRMRVGGETKCAGNPLNMVSVSFSAAAHVVIYHNGRQLPLDAGTGGGAGGYSKATLRAKNGDVFALRVAGSSAARYGVVAAISNEEKGTVIATGRNKWLAASATASGGAAGDAWLLPSFNACAWKPAVLVPSGEVSPTISNSAFPFLPGRSDVVWASGASGSQDILLRHKLGGEC